MEEINKKLKTEQNPVPALF